MSSSEPLTTAQVAAAVSKTPRTINRMVQRGQITPITKLPGRTGAHLFHPDVIEAARSHGTPPKPNPHITAQGA